MNRCCPIGCKLDALCRDKIHRYQGVFPVAARTRFPLLFNAGFKLIANKEGAHPEDQTN